MTLYENIPSLTRREVLSRPAARGDGVARHVEIVAGLEQIFREEAARQNWALGEEETLELLRMDLELNAQGLGVWLDSRQTSAAGA